MQCGPAGLVCEQGQEVGAERQHLGTYVAFTLGRKRSGWSQWGPGTTSSDESCQLTMFWWGRPRNSSKGPARPGTISSPPCRAGPGFCPSCPSSPGQGPGLSDTAQPIPFYLLIFPTPLTGPGSSPLPTPAPVPDMAASVDPKRHTPPGSGSPDLANPAPPLGAKRPKVWSGSTVGGRWAMSRSPFFVRRAVSSEGQDNY